MTGYNQGQQNSESGMAMESQQRERRGISRFIWLLGFLILFAIGWGILICRVPMLLQGEYPQFHLDRDTGLAKLTLTNWQKQNPWSQEICFDVRAGSLDWKMSREIDGTFFGEGTDLGDSQYRIISLGEDKYRLMSLHDSKVADREFEFPHFPYQVNGRFGVAESFTVSGAGYLKVMDFDESSTVKTTNVGGIRLSGGIKPINGVDAFLRLQVLAPAASKTPKHQVEHFSIGSDLAATPGATWQVLSFGTIPSQSVVNCNEEIVSVNPTSFEVEFRDANNGKLIHTMPLMKGMDPVAMPCHLWPNFLRIEPIADSPRFLDLKRRKWLPAIEGGNFGPNGVLDDKFIHFRGFRGRMKSKIFDIEREVMISEFDSYSFTDFIDEDSILDVSFLSGLTFQKMDLQTGEVLQTWKPFWWVIPLTSVLCIGWLIWSWFWLSGPGQSQSVTIWVDVAIVSLLPLVLCIIRMRYIGKITDLQRIPVGIAQGIVVALLACGVAWLVHSRMRIVPRIVPLLLAMAVLAAAVTISFDWYLAYVIPGAIQSLIPTCAFLICFLGIRRLGYRLFAPGELEDAAPTEKASLVTIRDMFLLTAVLAMLFAGLMPWLPGLGGIYHSLQQVMSALGQFAILSLAPVVAWCLAMSQTKLRWLGDVLFLGTFAFLIMSAAYRFSGSSSLIYNLLGFFPSMTALPAMCFVATYWIASCFKLRGWKFTRKKVAIASEE